MRTARLPFWLAAFALAGCQATAQFLQEVFKERPPLPLEAADVTSDMRMDSTGALFGTLVGEGTSYQVHLLSSDTGIIAGLARRFRPEHARRGDIWEWLSRQGTVEVDPRDLIDPGPGAEVALVGSPDGHTGVRVRDLLLHGSPCGWRGAQAEFVVEDARAGGPSLRGPVVGSLRASASGGPTRYYRTEPPAPSDSLTHRLLLETGSAMDSIFTRQMPAAERPLSSADLDAIDLNGLNDMDAADVRSFRLDDGRIRYAVALREQRRAATGENLLAAGMMVWDSTGLWRQFVFRPTLLEVRRRGQLTPHRGWPPLFWRRIDAVSGFGFDHDYLWLEQVDPVEGRVLWIVLEPRANTVVAAAEVAGSCGY